MTPESLARIAHNQRDARALLADEMDHALAICGEANCVVEAEAVFRSRTGYVRAVFEEATARGLVDRVAQIKSKWRAIRVAKNLRNLRAKQKNDPDLDPYEMRSGIVAHGARLMRAKKRYEDANLST